MQCKINNKSDFDISEIEELIQDLFSFSQNRLGFKKPVTLTLLSDETNTSPLGKTAHYDPSTMEVVVYVYNRHPKDIMRSFSHELVHHNQNENGMFDKDFGNAGAGYAQSNPHLRKMEKQAYLEGSVCFRDWEDGYKSSNPNILNERRIYKMSTKKWKNKELNGLLNEKWGFSMDLNKLNENREEKIEEISMGASGETESPSDRQTEFKKLNADRKKREAEKKKKSKPVNEEEKNIDPSTADGQYYDPEGHADFYRAAVRNSKKKKSKPADQNLPSTIDPSTADGQHYDPEGHADFYRDAVRNSKKKKTEESKENFKKGLKGELDNSADQKVDDKLKQKIIDELTVAQLKAALKKKQSES